MVFESPEYSELGFLEGMLYKEFLRFIIFHYNRPKKRFFFFKPSLFQCFRALRMQTYAIKTHLLQEFAQYGVSGVSDLSIAISYWDKYSLSITIDVITNRRLPIIQFKVPSILFKQEVQQYI